MAKFASFTTFLCTIWFGLIFGSQLFLLTTNNWYIRDASYHPKPDIGFVMKMEKESLLTDEYGKSPYDEYGGNKNTFIRDSLILLIATSLAAIVYAYIKKQFQTMKKWLIALVLFLSASAITCIFADRAGPNGIVIDHKYYHWKDVAYVELHLFGQSNDQYWYEDIPNEYFQYKLVMKNGASINVFDLFLLSNIVELDQHVRKLGIEVVNGYPIKTEIKNLKEPIQMDGFAKIKKENKLVKVLYKNDGIREKVYQQAKMNADYKKNYTAIFSGETLQNAALTDQQKQMLKKIFKR